jgi:amidase
MELVDLTALAAVEIAARVRDGRSCAVDVARAHLHRIAEREQAIGAFQAHDAQRVLAEAGGVDARPDRFALPLAGVPVAITDSIDVSGYPTRHGSSATSCEPVRRDDELVKRLRAAGAVIVGKTRMPELGIWGFTHSALGTTRNPLDESLDPGGSSGGSAAAVVAGMAALALGTDGGGSIRVPAADCGLVGLKPGIGRLPLPGGADQLWCGLGVTGLIARTADDVALLFGVLDGRAADLDAVAGPERIVLSMRNPSPVARLHPDHRGAAIGAAARLRVGPGGAAVTLADPPYPRGLVTQWIRRWQAGVAQEVAGLLGTGAEPSRTRHRSTRCPGPQDSSPRRPSTQDPRLPGPGSGSGLPDSQRPSPERPGPERPGPQDPGPQKPGSQRSSAEQPSAPQPGPQKPGSQRSSAEQPSTPQPGTQRPKRERAGAERPDPENPAQDEAAAEPPVLERRTATIARKGRRVLRFTPPGPDAPAAWRDRMVEWMDAGGYDLLVGPAVAGPPPPAGALAGRGYLRTLLAAAARTGYTQAWNLAGLPAVVAPVLVNGRPVGVQLVGRPGAEATLLAAAARLEHRVVPAVGAATPRIYV